MTSRSKYSLLALLIIALLVAGAVMTIKHKQQTLTRYEAADGWVYQCSQPIKAKTGTSQALGHPQGLVPVDESEAARYCHKVGIE